MDSVPNWMKKLGNLVIDAIEGTMVNHIYLYSPQGGWVIDIHPSLLRMHDSEELIWSGFSSDLKRIMAFADEVEEMKLYEDGAVIKASFVGHPFTLRLRNEPREDAEIEGLVDGDGNVTLFRDAETATSALDKSLN